MNYGEEFVKIYNKEFSLFRKDTIERIEKDYGSPDDDEDLHKVYLNELYGKSNKIRKKDNKGEYSSGLTGLSLGLMSKKYKYNRIQNIVNKDIHKLFNDKQKYSQYSNFGEFLKLFSKFLIITHHQNFLRNNQKEFIKLLNKEKINSFFINKINKDGIYELDTNFGDKKRELDYKLPNLISNKIELKEVEKSILLNILFFHLNGSDFKNVPLTEKYRLLILCSSTLKEEDFFNIKTGYKPFDYFKSGINKSSKFKGDKRLILENIIFKLEELSRLKEIVNSIKILKRKDNFYF